MKILQKHGAMYKDFNYQAWGSCKTMELKFLLKMTTMHGWFYTKEQMSDPEEIKQRRNDSVVQIYFVKWNPTSC